MHSLPIAAVCVFVTLTLQAQQGDGAGQNQEAPTLSVRTNLVLLPTRVQKKNGDTIYGLTRDQFIVEDDGVRQNVQIDDNPGSMGVSLVVAVQCGRTAAKELNKLKGLGTMIDGIVGAAPREVAIVAYGETPYLLSDFSSSADDVHRGLSRLKPCGDFHAATIDAVHYSLGLLERRQKRYRRAIILIGETRDHGSHSKLHEVVGELGTTDTVIYTVLILPTKNEFLTGLRYGPDGPKQPEPPSVYPSGPRHTSAPGATAPPRCSSQRNPQTRTTRLSFHCRRYSCSQSTLCGTTLPWNSHRSPAESTRISPRKRDLIEH